MKSLVRSWFVLFALGLLLVLGLVNTCQLDSLQRAVIRNTQIVDQLSEGGVRVSSSGTGTGSTNTSGVVFSDEEEQALADPANLLVRRTRPILNAKTFVRGGTLRIKEGSDPRGLNVHIANGADVSKYARFVANRLATRHPDNLDVWGPELAISVTTTDDGLSYVIRLRKGVQWHTPAVDWETGRYDWLRGDHELTSDDYAFVFDMLRNAQVAGRISALRNYFEPMDRYEILDRYTFKVVFKERLFTNLISLLDLEPSPRWLFMYDEDGQKWDEATWGLKINEHWFNRKAIGTGPYTFVRWDPGVRLEFERNERYWGETPAFDRLLVHIIKDQVAWPRKLKTGELDITQIQPEQYRTEILEAKGPYLGKDGLKLVHQPTLGYFYIGWNGDTPYFSDKLTRQAMTLAMNRQGIIDNVFHGLGKLHTGPVAQQTPCYDHTIEPWPFDLDAARAKLDEAGWIDRDRDGIREKVIDGETVPFEFTMLIYGSSTEFETLANIYREDLLSVGVRLNPIALEWSTMLKKMDEREFDAYTGAWVTNWETDLFQLWHSSEADRPNGSNRIGFRNPDADRIAVALRSEFDPAERVALCHEFHGLVHEQQPYTFIYQRERPVLYWDYVNDPEFSLVWPYRDVRMWSFREARP